MCSADISFSFSLSGVAAVSNLQLIMGIYQEITLFDR